MNTLLFMLRGAVQWTALFLFTAGAMAGTDDHPVIKAAQNLSLQKDRVKASQILIQEISKDTDWSKKTVQELVASLGKLTKLFYTEAAQQKYEHGESLLFSGLPDSDKSYKEALQLEPDNVAIRLGLMRSYLSGRQCDKAFEQASAIEELNPYSSELYVLRMRAQICVAGEKQEVEPEPGWFNPAYKNYLALARIENLAAAEDWPAVRAQVASAGKDLLDLIETHYWLWRAEEQPDRARDHAAAYLSNCKNLTSGVRRKHRLIPDLCAHAAEIKKAVENAQ